MKEKRALPVELKTFSYGKRLGLFYAIARMLANEGTVFGERPLKHATYKLFEEFSKAHPKSVKNWKGVSESKLRKIENHFKIRICIFQKKPAPEGITEVYTSAMSPTHPTLLLSSNDDYRDFQIITDFRKYQEKKHECRFCYKIIARSNDLTRHERTCSKFAKTSVLGMNDEEKVVLPVLLETFSYRNKLCVFYAIAHMFANRGRSRTALPPDAHPYKDHNFACVKTKLICGEKRLENDTHELFGEFKKAYPTLTQNWTGASKRILPKIEEYFKIRICIFQKKLSDPDGQLVTPIYKPSQPVIYPSLLLASNDECTHVQIISDLMKYQETHVCRFCGEIMDHPDKLTSHEQTCLKRL